MDIWIQCKLVFCPSFPFWIWPVGKLKAICKRPHHHFLIWNKMSAKKLEVWWYHSFIDPNACFLGFHVPCSWHGCSCLTQQLFIMSKPNKIWPEKERNDQKWQNTEQRIVIWSDYGWAGTVFVSEEDRYGMMLIYNIPEKHLSPAWVCNDSTALPTTLSPGLKIRLQSPSANKQRGVFTFILAYLWNLRAGVGRWFSRLIIWPPSPPLFLALNFIWERRG